MSKNTMKWWKAAGVRAVKTMVQTAVDWIVVASACVLMGILSLFASLAGLPEVEG